MRNLETFLEPYIKAIYESLTEKYEYDEDTIRSCLYYDLFEAIARTSHVVKATTVAWGAGFCIYAARLIAAIGAKKVISENIPGKGSDIHKVLSVASLELLDRWKRGKELNEHIIKEIITNTIIELDDLVGIKKDEKERKETEDKVFRMLKNLFNIVPRALQKLEIEFQQYTNLRFYTELELVDYKLHIWGVPDLIIEDPTTRKAIVIEWKSDEETPREIEKYQVYIYSMLEAIRLGYGVTFRDLINAIAPDNIEETKVLPLIIRPNHAYSDHPLFPISGSSSAKPVDIQTLRERLKKILITSTYLTLLLMDIDSLLYGAKKHRDESVITTKERCSTKHIGLNTNIYIFRMTPAMLFSHSGNPKSQDRYPCKVCPFSNANSKLGECSFYFGSFEKDKLDKLMWLYRFKVYRERDRDLIMYKALYFTSEQYGLTLRDFEKRLGTEFCGLRLDLESLRVDKYSCKKGRRKSCGNFEINFRKFDVYLNAKIGVYEIAKEFYKNSEYWNDIVVLKRKLLPCESTTGEIPYIALPRHRQPVLVTLIEDHVKHPTLGVSLFGRVEKALSLGEVDEDLGLECGEEEACIVITPISQYLRLPFRLFRRYVNMFGITRALVTEVGADLTNIDLATLHALHIALKNATTSKEFNDITHEEVTFITKYVEEALKEAFSTYVEA